MAFNGHLGFCQCPGGLVGPACSGLPSLVLRPKADFPESPGAVGAVEPGDSRQGRGLTKGAGTGTDPLPEPSAARACCWGAGSALRADLGTHWGLGLSPQANAAGGEIQREFKARGPRSLLLRVMAVLATGLGLQASTWLRDVLDPTLKSEDLKQPHGRGNFPSSQVTNGSPPVFLRMHALEEMGTKSSGGHMGACSYPLALWPPGSQCHLLRHGRLRGGPSFALLPLGHWMETLGSFQSTSQQQRASLLRERDLERKQRANKSIWAVFQQEDNDLPWDYGSFCFCISRVVRELILGP